MIPYADFFYFGILLYIALPTLLVRRLFGFCAMGFVCHRGDADRPVRDHRAPGAGHRSGGSCFRGGSPVPADFSRSAICGC